MKTKIYTRIIFLAAVLSLAMVNFASAATLTVADGSDVHRFIPIDGLYMDQVGTRTQMIYPSSNLSALIGTNITGLTFYSSNTTTQAFGSNVCEVKLAEVDDTSIPEDAFLISEFTTVYTGHLGISSSKVAFTFDEEYSYTGKNLVIDITVTTAGGYDITYFYGSEDASNASRCQSSAVSSTYDFLPKTTFTYDVSSSSCRMPILRHTDLTETSASFSWTTTGDESQWQYLCLPAATILTVSHWSEATLTTATSVTVSGLNSKTAYKFYIRSYCDESEQSKVAHNSFVTLCGVEALPFSEDFNGLSSGIPLCWDNSEGTTDNLAYRFNYYATGADDDGGCVRFDSYSNSENNTNFLATPIMDVLDTAVLRFKYKNPKGSNLSVYYTIDGGSMTAFPGLTSLPTKTSWFEQSANLPAACVGHEVTIIFKGISNWGSGDAYIYLDDIYVKAKAHTFTNASGDGTWDNTANWDEGVLPTLNDKVIISKPITISAGTKATAKSVIIDQHGTHSGSLSIEATGRLIIADSLRKATGNASARTFSPTTEDDLYIGSSAEGNGALVIGSHEAANGLNRATVDFYTLSHGVSGSSASVSQYVGTPFGNHPRMIDQYYNSWMYRIAYNGRDIEWQRIDGNNTLEAFQGYCVISADAPGHSYWMQGELVASADQTIDLAYCGGESTEAQNENMLANSWAAPIQIRAFQSSDFVNADATIYIFNSGSPDDYKSNGNGATFGALPGQYAQYTPGTAAASDVIPSMQAFSVYTNAADPSITLDYSRLVYNPAVAGLAVTPNKARRFVDADGNEPDRMRIYVSAESGYCDMLYMLEHEQYSENFENGYDGRKIFGLDEAPQLYAISADGNMGINCVPTFEGTVVGFRMGTEDNTYTFTFEYAGGNMWYLNDLKEQTSTLIDHENTYTFTASTNDDPARFAISAKPLHHMPTAIDNNVLNPESDSRKLMIDGTLYILRSGRLYTATGALAE